MPPIKDLLLERPGRDPQEVNDHDERLDSMPVLDGLDHACSKFTPFQDALFIHTLDSHRRFGRMILTMKESANEIRINHQEKNETKNYSS